MSLDAEVGSNTSIWSLPETLQYPLQSWNMPPATGSEITGAHGILCCRQISQLQPMSLRTVAQ